MDFSLKLIRTSGLHDIITARKRMNGDYLVRYVDQNKPNTVWVFGKSQDAFLTYIENIVFFIKNDLEFTTLQLTVPTYPSINLSVQELNDLAAHKFLNTVEDYIFTPPSSFRE